MWFRIKRKRPTSSDCASLKPTNPTPVQSEAASREMYQRIARGHAFAEAEEQARRRWRS